MDFRSFVHGTHLNLRGTYVQTSMGAGIKNQNRAVTILGVLIGDHPRFEFFIA